MTKKQGVFPFENDFFALSVDKNYTHGTEFSRLIPGTGPRWLSNLGRWRPFFHLSEEEFAVNYSLGQKIFTPEDLSQTALIPDDRPYAGYLFISAALLSRYQRSEDLETGNILEVTLGIVGPDSGADNVQEWFHDVIDGETPMGWDNQLGNEPCLGVSYSRSWSIIQPGPGSFQLVGDHQFGFALHKGKLRLALSVMSRTKEFSTQEDLTRYGALNVSFTL